MITFSKPKSYPYGPFVGATVPILQAAQFAECTEANFSPNGTGPFRITEFRSNDIITMEANSNYRDP